MSKTIVSIISEQTIPNYLFIKEMFLPGDTLMFISSKKMSNRIKWIKDSLNWTNYQSMEIVLENDGDEEKSDVIQNFVFGFLIEKQEYAVNLTGGTKFMALVLQSLFERFNSKFYYIPYPQNHIISLSDSQTREIKLRITVDEYFSLYGESLRKPQNTLIDFDYTKYLFHLFIDGLQQEDFEVINSLRSYRDSKNGIVIEKIEQCEDKPKKPQIKNLSKFLDNIKFQHEDGVLSMFDIRYLTGGWFEEYIYHHINQYVRPNDITIGVKIDKTNNDLDVVFTLGNKMYVVECKTGVEKEVMLKEIVYKASALKSALLGLSAKSFIFALSEDNERWKTAASNMNITYYGRGCFITQEKFDSVMNEIIKSSFN